MTFRILDYIDDLEVLENKSSQVTIKCPICYSKIRIGKRNSAYFCIAGCTPTDIRKALNVHAPNYFPKPYVAIQPIPCPKNIELHPATGEFNPQQSVYFSTNEQDKQRVRQTTYVYDSTHRIVRVDRLVDGDKRFFPLKWIDDNWRVKADNIHPLMHEGLITDSSKFVIFVEGEKCAVEMCRQGLLALTPPSFGWSEDRLRQAFDRLLFKVRGFVVIPDNDEEGWRKANRVQKSAWKVGLPCKLLDFKSIYKREGDDVFDLIQAGFDVKKYLQETLTNVGN